MRPVGRLCWWLGVFSFAHRLHYGNCYVEWDDANQGKLIFMSTSTNGGTIWGSPKTTATPKAHGVGGQPLVKSNGNVIVPIDNASMTGVLVFTSTDGGKSWGAATSLSDIKFHQPAGGLRADPFISASMDGAETVYIVWADCRVTWMSTFSRVLGQLVLRNSNSLGQ